MKRLWVRPSARGLHLGRLLTQAVLIAPAKPNAAPSISTQRTSMGPAYRMYVEMGFTPCAPYNDNPVEGLAYLSVKHIEPAPIDCDSNAYDQIAVLKS